MLNSRFAAAALAAAALVSMVSGCASNAPAPSTSTAAAPSVVLSIRDPWVKTPNSGMSPAFGTLVNHTGKELTITAATSKVSPVMELHEVAMDGGKMVMRPKTGGFTIAAGGTHELKPGGDHLMLMEVTSPVKAGDHITITLTLNDGTKVEISAVGKPFAGANESYAPSATPKH